MSVSAAVPTGAEIESAVANLERSRDALLDRCAGIAHAAWSAAPAGGGWSPEQVLEHLVIVERRSLGLLEKMLTEPAEPDWAERSAPQEAVLPATAVPSVKVAAPAPLLPQGGRSREDLVSDFQAARGALIAFARRPGQALKEHTRNHPVVGCVNGLQWLHLAAFHTDRHRAQIENAQSAAAGA